MITSGRSIFAVALFAAALALLNGCSDGGGPSTGSGTGTGTGTGTGSGTGGGTVTTPPPTLGAGCAQSGTDLICVSLSASLSTIAADNSSTSILTGTLTRNGSPLPGTILNFTLSPTTMGSLTATSGVTNSSGVATTTFQAGGTIGAVGITVAHSGSTAASTLALSLTQAPGATPAGIQFVTATPAVLGVTGSGGPTTAAVIFKVTDTQGGPIPNQSVNFTLVGPTGAYIGTVDGSPNTATGTTNSLGNVTVPLNSGNVAGPVTITASVTVSGTTFNTSTSVISIGGAVPSAKHFSIATQRFNLPGLVRFGVENDLSVFLADRFSNYNILAGTQVSFFTEAGAVDTSVTLSDTGSGVVKIRTQLPLPYSVPATHPFYPNALGWLRVIAVTRGEETFGDANGNGIFDFGVDVFNTATMDLGEPFVDSNDNGLWDGPNCNLPLPGPNQNTPPAGVLNPVACDPAHPGEHFVDTNNNGQYDGPNGVWDGPGCTQAGCNQSPNIWTSIMLQFTGHPICTVSPQNGWVIPNGGLQVFTITIRDVNNNVPVPGVTLSGVAMNNSSGSRTDIGTGNLGIPMRDGISAGPFTYTFTLADNSPFVTNDATGFTITVTGSVQDGINACTPVNGSGTVQ